jgi:hypothetical protein
MSWYRFGDYWWMIFFTAEYNIMVGESKDQQVIENKMNT